MAATRVSIAIFPGFSDLAKRRAYWSQGADLEYSKERHSGGNSCSVHRNSLCTLPVFPFCLMYHFTQSGCGPGPGGKERRQGRLLVQRAALYRRQAGAGPREHCRRARQEGAPISHLARAQSLQRQQAIRTATTRPKRVRILSRLLGLGVRPFRLDSDRLPAFGSS